MTSPSWLLVVFFISAVGAGFLSPPSSDLFLPQNPRYFPPVYFKFPVSTTTTTEVAVTLSPLRISTYSSLPAATPEVRKPPPPPPSHDHPHPPHDHDHPHPPPPPPPPKKKDRRPSAAQDQDDERGFPGEATLVKFEDWPPVQVYGSQPGIKSRVSETLDRSSSPGLEARKDRRPAADGGGQRSWSGTATPVNVDDLSPRVQVYGSQPSGRIITSKSSRVSGEKTALDQSSAPLRVTTKSLTSDRRVQVPAPVVVKSRSYSFAPLDGLGSSETISNRFQQGRRPSADPVSTTAKSMRARSVPAPVVVRSRSYSFAPPDGLDSSSATSSRFQQQQRRRSPPPARDVVSNYVQMNA